jgi:hypothetical protein
MQYEAKKEVGRQVGRGGALRELDTKVPKQTISHRLSYPLSIVSHNLSLT